ncbi:purple acid phosphatase 23-like, partial [Carica papaya]|uniref:purple acid phosphatase 23-like n=1 Tax=Carica papaya TaxID=3649 RepID=UPI000B8C8E29
MMMMMIHFGFTFLSKIQKKGEAAYSIGSNRYAKLHKTNPVEVKHCLLLTFFSIITKLVAIKDDIPTTLDGPFEPVTRRFDQSLRRGSDDLPMDHPRLKRNVTSMYPEQIALAISTPSSMWVSWVTGKAQIGSNVTPLDPSSISSDVWYGKASGKYTMKRRGNATVYSQLYPFEGLLNYTSGIIHHVRIDGLEPGARYYYKCGDGS